MSAREQAAALGYLAGWRLVRLLPDSWAAALFDLVADKASDNGRGMQQLRANLSRVVGKENVTRKLVRASMRSYMRYWKEAFRLPAMNDDPQVLARVREGLVGQEHFDASVERGKGVILALTHSGNWDMAGAFLVSHFGPFTTVAERLKPEFLFDAFVDYRQHMGFNVIAHQGGQAHPFEQLVEVLRGGSVVCLLAERDLSRTGVPVTFFGEEANMAAGPAALAKETGAALHVVHSWFDGDGWGLSVSPALEVTDVATTTQEMADLFAANIAQHPEDWHMLQPLWNEDIEKRAERRAAKSSAECAAERQGR